MAYSIRYATELPNQPWILTIEEDLYRPGKFTFAEGKGINLQLPFHVQPFHLVKDWCDVALRGDWYFSIEVTSIHMNIFSKFYFADEKYLTMFLLKWDTELNG